MDAADRRKVAKQLDQSRLHPKIKVTFTSSAIPLPSKLPFSCTNRPSTYYLVNLVVPNNQSDHPKALFEESKMDNLEDHFEAMEAGQESEYVTEDVTEIPEEAFESNPEVRTVNCA